MTNFGITLTIEAPALVEAMNNFSAALMGRPIQALPVQVEAKQAAPVENQEIKKKVKKETAAPAAQAQEAPEIQKAAAPFEIVPGMMLECIKKVQGFVEIAEYPVIEKQPNGWLVRESEWDSAILSEETIYANFKPAETKAAAAKEQPKADAIEYTPQDVRKKLYDLSQAGKQAQVKKLLADFGVAKLSDLPEEKYSELMAAAEEI